MCAQRADTDKPATDSFPKSCVIQPVESRAIHVCKMLITFSVWNRIKSVIKRINEVCCTALSFRSTITVARLRHPRSHVRKGNVEVMGPLQGEVEGMDHMNATLRNKLVLYCERK